MYFHQLKKDLTSVESHEAFKTMTEPVFYESVSLSLGLSQFPGSPSFL